MELYLETDVFFEDPCNHTISAFTGHLKLSNAMNAYGLDTQINLNP